MHSGWQGVFPIFRHEPSLSLTPLYYQLYCILLNSFTLFPDFAAHITKAAYLPNFARLDKNAAIVFESDNNL